MHRLILFDVDGTLLSTNGQAGEALGTALRETFGTAGPIEHYPWAGKTDPQIVFELLGHAGIPRADVQPRLSEVFDVYCDSLARRLTPANTSALAGVHELLQALGQRPDIAVGLLTGNIRRGADIKLTAAGLRGSSRWGPSAQTRRTATCWLPWHGSARRRSGRRVLRDAHHGGGGCGAGHPVCKGRRCTFNFGRERQDPQGDACDAAPRRAARVPRLAARPPRIDWPKRVTHWTAIARARHPTRASPDRRRSDAGVPEVP